MGVKIVKLFSLLLNQYPEVFILSDTVVVRKKNKNNTSGQVL